MKYKNESGLTWREQAVFDYMCDLDEGVVTHDIYKNVPMAKATALKALSVLEAKNLIFQEMFGPSKIWYTNKFCEKCGGIMKAQIVYKCENCDDERFI